ncbi:hypothetical protein EX895_000717 [Sporisorium graminicola]|uniref:Homeobox domain-containing protein n=1 Tax=Sporisorium graminicola TaxID=280036 RepID=A0A4V6EUI4_9BASI|nr:hypothetical protein EX895_000717 [Sporisorium graminicola]TKY90719.1 hypothetical protein EX895_000717 [Sporisorium graminicola]
MVVSLSSRPISSVREQQQASPRLPSVNNTPHFRSASTFGNPSPRIGSSLSTPSDRSAPPPPSDDRHSSPPAASARSSEYSFDRHSVSSLGQRSISTAATLPLSSYDVDHLPPLASHGIPKLGPVSPRSIRTHPPSMSMNASDKADLAARRASPPPPPSSLRRPASPAGKISNHSAEWDMHSDRGSPRLAGRRPGPPLPPASANTGPVHSAYTRGEYASSPRSMYREAAYRDPRELSPVSSGIKRKLSISSDMGAARRGLPERVDRNGNAWTTSADYPPPPPRAAAAAYADADYYRARGRGETPERTYPGSYSREATYPSRYADPRMDDARYSPRHAYPASPSSSRTAYRGSVRDAAAPSGHPYPPVSRYSDRYSPSPRSPSYAPRQAMPISQAPPPAHDPYSRSAPHSSHLRRPSPPPYASDARPVLPPLSSRPPTSRYPAPPPPPANARSSRYTPPLEAVAHADRLSPSPEPHGYSEPFYPDRRLYFARERIQDPEMDEYYHGPIGSAGGAGGKARYAAEAYYDPYGSPHAGGYQHPTAHAAGKPSNGGAGPLPIPSPGMGPMGGRHPHDARVHHAGPYGPGDYMPHDPHAHAGVPRMSRPGGVMPIPAAHVPPGPSAGIAPPPRRRGKLPKPVTDLLKTWLLEHASHPYPTEDEKRSLCSMTGLTLSQVSNWFINARRRILLPTGANGSPSGSTAAQVKAAFRDDSASPEP